jgi:DNA-directed RNA polymerase alpha subunit
VFDWVSESVENENLSSDIIDCSFSVRTLNTLHKLNILTVKELVSYSELELFKKGVRGKSTMRDINNVLSSLGLVLKYKKLELGMTVN